MGLKWPNTTRSAVVRFFNFKDKELVLKSAQMLKHLTSPRVSIVEYFAPKVRLNCKKPWQFSDDLRAVNVKVNLIFDKTYAMGKTYVYESLGDRVVVRDSQPLMNSYPQ